MSNPNDTSAANNRLSRGTSTSAGLPGGPGPQRPRASARRGSRRRTGKARRPHAFFGIVDWFSRLVATPLALPMDLALFGVIGASLLLYSIADELPQVEALLEVKLEEPLRVYTADGSLMAEYGVQRRRAVDFEDIPPDLVNAFLAAEDSRFYDHRGIDLIGLGRAAYAVAQAGEATQGGSTISMQVARNFFLTPEKTVKRKLTEILLAMRMETALSKDQILELYLNKIFFGNRAYGISAAAEFYYNKTLDELSLPEMAMLAGLPKAPSANNPLADPERARERRDWILDRMLELGYIDAVDHSMAWVSPVTATAYVAPVEFDAGYAAEMARQAMVDRFGAEEAYRLGLEVTTTIDEKLQTESDRALRRGLMAYNRRHGYHGPEDQLADIESMSEQALDQYLAERPVVPDLPVAVVLEAGASSAEVYLGGGETRELRLWQVNHMRKYVNENVKGRRQGRVDRVIAAGDVIRLRQNNKGSWILAQVPTVGGALVALSPTDGAIRAISGGYEFDWSKFNRATDARRQPGSTFKPFVYAAALGKGYTPASLVSDTKTSFGSWKPKNADGKYMGTIRMRVALAKSRNLAIINQVNKMGIDYTRDFLQRFGYSMEDMPRNYGLALGGGSSTPLQLAAAYAVFANGGYKVEPHIVQRIEDANGNLLFQAEPPRACVSCWLEPKAGEAEVLGLDEAGSPLAQQVLDPRISYNMHSMLQDVITDGTAKRARRLRRSDIAGKTGTTNESRDSWFAGYMPRLVTVAWMGMDDNRPLGAGEWGGTAALGMWVDFMADALEDEPIAKIKRPEGMVPVRVSSATGRATSGGGVLEYIRSEYQLMTLGPNPVKYAAASGSGSRSGNRSRSSGPRRSAPRRSAPRVMDELF
ncbi:penicillin-binding protein 1A [uncultured Thiohalocapsa sp.]|uniref:penicillin-binding protein 1A n=1 Tax=uncultured Thiohalocapsa sp. TaxID=768990 RepID=UPI0025EE49E8|nr:penicillin-binding protein 1A [uncultured Thiohalocapsa sp.]